MAANEYYNSFNGGTPQLMGAQAVSNHYAPSAPPPYQEFHPQAPGFPPRPHQAPYNIADFKYNYDPNIQYGPSTPPQQHAQPYHHGPRPHLQQPHAQQQGPNVSTANLRPPRSSSEPPSPYERQSSRPHTEHRRKYHHSHSHSRRRSRSRSRDRERERQRSKGHKEKNTFLGAIGGSVVGDLIFPGLGTIGGAVLGGWGGHEATKKKEERERDRERERNSHGGSGSGRARRRERSYEAEWEDGKRRRGEY